MPHPHHEKPLVKMTSLVPERESTSVLRSFDWCSQEVSDCCPPLLSPACVMDRRAFVGVRERCPAGAELLVGAPRFRGFDDEAQDTLSLGVHGTLPLDPVLLKCFFELAPADALQKSLPVSSRWMYMPPLSACLPWRVLCPWSKPSYHGRPSVNVRLARWPLSLLRFGHEKSGGRFDRLHQRFVLLHKHRAEGGRLQLENLQIVFQGRTG